MTSQVAPNFITYYMSGKFDDLLNSFSRKQKVIEMSNHTESESSDEVQIAFKMIISVTYIYAAIFVTLCMCAISDYIHYTIEKYRLEMTYQSIDHEAPENTRSQSRTMDDETKTQ